MADEVTPPVGVPVSDPSALPAPVESQRIPSGAQTGTLVVDIQRDGILAGPPVALLIDGQPVNAQIGVNTLTVAAGGHRVELFCVRAAGRKQFGRASLDVTVPERGSVKVFYALPYVKWGAGNIGLVHQKHSGKMILILPWIMIASIFLMTVVLLALSFS